ncbi:MAG: hypothetical protein C4536_02495 [Actinobacteria bacterium]|jgi:hypothetical protein|nr:MAG: hypothetical protein C4536_02495 [Actinomycetota bacterium]
MGETEKPATEGTAGKAPPGGASANLALEVEGIDADAIVRRIEERVEERRADGVYRDLPLLELEEERTGGGEAEVSFDPLHELIFLNQLARQYAEVTSHYPIGSRRSLLGPFIKVSKKAMRRFMTPYMDALFAKQREFNAQCLRSMETFLEMIKRERERSYHGGLDRYTAWVELGFAAEDEAELLREAARRFPEGKPIIHLYSGKGDFLAAAAGEDRAAFGVEEDPRLVKIAQDRDLKVLSARPLDFLESQPLESLQAVFVQELGERGDSRELLWLVTALADRLEKGGIVVALNHHPHSVLGVEEAFADPTLLRLVHPGTMQGLFERAGFREVEAIPSADFSPAEKEEWKEKLGGAALESGDLAELLFSPRRYLLEARR